MKNNYTPNMDLSFEGSNLILKLGPNEEDVAGTLQAFLKLEFGKGTRFKKYVQEGDLRTPFEDFLKKWEEARATPEARQIKALEKRITVAEVSLGKISERLKALEKPVGKVRRPRILPEGQKHKVINLPAAVRWHEKVAAGDEKFVKMNAIVQACGLRIIAIIPGRAYDDFEANEIRAAKTVEFLYDTEGEERLRVILTVMSQLIEITGRISDTFLMALRHALYAAAKPLHPDEVFSKAVDIFSVPWPQLGGHLDMFKASYGFPRQTILGMLITGELKLPE